LVYSRPHIYHTIKCDIQKTVIFSTQSSITSFSERSIRGCLNGDYEQYTIIDVTEKHWLDLQILSFQAKPACRHVAK
jgi:hypothetical protein